MSCPFKPRNACATRTSGNAAPIAAPKHARAIGRDEEIEIRADNAADIAKYRIERADGARATFKTIADGQTLPFVDRDVEDGVRYGYRIVGLKHGGDETLPARIFATTKSAGIVAGSIDVEPLDRGGAGRLDLLLGKIVPRGGDIALQSITSGGRAIFFDDRGRMIAARVAGSRCRKSSIHSRIC